MKRWERPYTASAGRIQTPLTCAKAQEKRAMLPDGCSVGYFRLRTKLRFAVPTTDSRWSSKPAFCRDKNRLNKPPTLLRWWNWILPTSTILLQALRCSKLTLPPPKASYTLCGGQNRLSQLLQASYTLCSAQNGLYQLLIRFVVLYTDFQKHTTLFAAVKTESTHFYKPSTSCTDDKTDSAHFCKPPTRFAVVKMYSPTSTSSLNALWC